MSDIKLQPELEIFLLSTGDLDKFYYNVINHPLSSFPKVYFYSLRSAFAWEPTPEGYEYWRSKNAMYIKHFGNPKIINYKYYGTR